MTAPDKATHIARLRELLGQGEIEKARVVAEQMLVGGHPADGWLGRAQISFLAERKKGAKANLKGVGEATKNALEARPVFPELSVFIGEVSVWTGEIQAAGKSFEHAESQAKQLGWTDAQQVELYRRVIEVLEKADPARPTQESQAATQKLLGQWKQKLAPEGEAGDAANDAESPAAVAEPAPAVPAEVPAAAQPAAPAPAPQKPVEPPKETREVPTPAKEAPKAAPPPPPPPAAEKQSAGGSPRVGSGQPTIKGALSLGEIVKAVRQRQSQIKSCYERGLASKPNLSGKIVVKFDIDSFGAVGRASVRQTTLNDKNVEGCITKVVRGLKFPWPSDGGSVAVTYPFVFGRK